MERLEAASKEREELARAISEKTAEAGAEAGARQKVSPDTTKPVSVVLACT